ncbi:unnamed protein product [Symbiodinium natans]|uniref:Uncharacterized protein n=1 Tax=Symbiodinium natans TaxID=878477 RepID=A0A812IJ40_9DINO|nr:unnamed protein product [Symbiodinium natans]
MLQATSDLMTAFCPQGGGRHYADVIKAARKLQRCPRDSGNIVVDPDRQVLELFQLYTAYKEKAIDLEARLAATEASLEAAQAKILKLECQKEQKEPKEVQADEKAAWAEVTTEEPASAPKMIKKSYTCPGTTENTDSDDEGWGSWTDQGKVREVIPVYNPFNEVKGGGKGQRGRKRQNDSSTSKCRTKDRSCKRTCSMRCPKWRRQRS